MSKKFQPSAGGDQALRPMFHGNRVEWLVLRKVWPSISVSEEFQPSAVGDGDRAFYRLVRGVMCGGRFHEGRLVIRIDGEGFYE